MKPLILGLLIFAAAGADWPQFQNTPGNTGYAAGVFVNPPSMDTVLKFGLGGSILAGPVVMGDTVYAATETGTLYAVNFRTGVVAWSYTDSAGIVSTPAADGRKIYIAGRSGAVVGLNRMTGAEAWRFNAEDTAALFREFQAPLKLIGSRLYAGCFNGRLYCLDTAGARQWDFRTYFYIKEGVAVRDSLVVLSSRDELVYGLVDRGDTCRLLWQVNPGACMAWTDSAYCNSFGCVALSRSTPSIADTLFFLNYLESDGAYWTTAYSVNSGRVLKHFSNYPEPTLNSTGFAVSGNGTVYCNGEYYVTNPLGANGSWWPPRPPPDPVPGWCLQRPGEGPPVVIGNYAVNLNAFNPTGLHFFNPATRAYASGLLMAGYRISSPLAASDSVLFFGTYEGILLGMGHGGLVTGSVSGRPEAVSLLQVYPNPSNPEAAIRFSVERPGPVSIRILSSAGRVVYEVDRQFPRGIHEVSWNGRAFASGVYFVSAMMDNRRRSTKITLLK